MEAEILEYVIKYLHHIASCKYPEEDCTCEVIGYDTKLITGGYLDSFSMVAVLVFIEKTFNVKIHEQFATPDNFDTINKMVKLIK